MTPTPELREEVARVIRDITVEKSACAIVIDGTAHWYEREITRVSDIRETAVGKVDCGYVLWGPRVRRHGTLEQYHST